jgi:hypothetical protein
MFQTLVSSVSPATSFTPYDDPPGSSSSRRRLVAIIIWEFREQAFARVLLDSSTAERLETPRCRCLHRLRVLSGSLRPAKLHRCNYWTTRNSAWTPSSVYRNYRRVRTIASNSLPSGAGKHTASFLSYSSTVRSIVIAINLICITYRIVHEDTDDSCMFPLSLENT